MRKGSLLVIMAVFLLSIVGCQSTPTKQDTSGLTKVRIVLDMLPNTNHTGLYVAKTKEYYKNQGLDVTIIQRGNNESVEQMIASGKAEFGISSQKNVTTSRADEVPVVSIATIMQHNTTAFASLKKDNITSPKDFEGKRYGGGGTHAEEATIDSLMKQYNANYKKVNKVLLGQTNFQKSIGRDADFEWIYYGWDGIEAKRTGVELNTIMLKDLNPVLDTYSPVIVTSETNADKYKDVVTKFMDATAQGYEFAIKNPTEAADILIQNVPDINKDLVKESQKWVSTKYQDDSPQWGVQKESVWTNYMNFLVDNQVIRSQFEVDEAFTNDFLPKAK